MTSSDSNAVWYEREPTKYLLNTQTLLNNPFVRVFFAEIQLVGRSAACHHDPLRGSDCLLDRVATALDSSQGWSWLDRIFEECGLPIVESMRSGRATQTHKSGGQYASQENCFGARYMLGFLHNSQATKTTYYC